MARGPCTFRQRDLAAALRGARAGGLEVARVEITKNGSIVIDTGKPEVEPEGKDDLDRELAEWARHGED
jgi:hypothetical protein